MKTFQMLKDRIRNSRGGEMLIFTLSQTLYLYRIFDCLGLTNDAHERKHPTIEMKKAKEYYAVNKKRIGEIEKFLEDDYSKMIFNKLIHYRQTKEKISQYSESPQYFPKSGVYKMGSDEVFVDCGAAAGDTFRQFVKKCHGNYKKVICFEPENYNLYALNKLKTQWHDFHVIPKGVYDRDGVLFFADGALTGKIIETAKNVNTTQTVSVQCIDSAKECEDATFIKMDIEGSEMKALSGAKETIKRNYPKLAICIYHSNEDLLDIPEWIHNLVPEYKIYIRQHIGDTVCYAIPR